MVIFYVKRIEAGKMELKQVPSKWRNEVAAELKKGKVR